MKVALVQPNYRRGVATGGYVFRANPPLGLCYLSAMLKKHDIAVDIIDANAFDYSPEVTADKVKGYDIVGISLLSPAYTFGTTLVKLLPKKIIKIAGNLRNKGQLCYCLKIY